MKTDIELCGVHLKNPIMNASGTFGSAAEYADLIDINRLGAVVTKGVSMEPWEGNATVRIAETPCGMLNAIGLQNPGIDTFLERDLKALTMFDTGIIVNVCGHTVSEYEQAVERLSDEPDIDMLEINVSCPNVKSGGIAFGTDPKELSGITKAVRNKSKKPVIMKLSPNVTSISEMARAAEEAGADAISLINTLTAMKIDIYKRKFVLANKTGGLSGPCIHPVAVRMVYDAAHAVKIPVIGMGGVACGEDAIELMMAGASAVAVGMMQFSNPRIMIEIIDWINGFMEKEGIGDIRKIVGIL